MTEKKSSWAVPQPKAWDWFKSVYLWLSPWSDPNPGPVMLKILISISSVGCLAEVLCSSFPSYRTGCLPGLGTAWDGTALQLVGAKTSGLHRTVANPNSIVILRLPFWLPRLPALERRCTGMPPRDCHSKGSLHECSPRAPRKEEFLSGLLLTSRLLHDLSLSGSTKKYKNS